MGSELLKTMTVEQVPSPASRRAVSTQALTVAAQTIVEDVRRGGEEALRAYAERLGDLPPGGQLFYGPEELERALASLDSEDQELLRRTATRIGDFAAAQRESLCELDLPIPGGRAGQVVTPVDCAGCYAPGGRFPLPSSVLMTAVTARVAGVPEVWVASPRPAPVTLAAAAVAEVDGLLAAGGAQAIAGLVWGAGPLPSCDVVVGPGNQYVTAAKQLVAGQVGIDMLAGPSELVVFADGTAQPDRVAADLLAQAEHDPLAWPVLVTTEAALVGEVNQALALQLEDLPTAETARAALAQGFAVVVADLNEGIALCDVLAPEHLELHLAEAEEVARRCRHYGALFVGPAAAEVLGDYGAGPNHTLPTGGTARHRGGLSVFHFLRIRTWMHIDDLQSSAELVRDAEKLARWEGLAAHERSARRRRTG